VFHGNNADVHVSGHAAREELKTFINVVRPQAFVPVHGEYRHLRAHAELAEEMKVPEVFLCEDGDAVVLDGGKARMEKGAVPSAHVFVDGLEVAGSVHGVIRDRRHLADDGVVVVTLAIDNHTGEVIQGPDLESHGFMDDPGEVFAGAAEAVLSDMGTIELPLDVEAVERSARRTVRRILSNETGRKPVVIPVVVEV
jgi:ribonuclease J